MPIPNYNRKLPLPIRKQRTVLQLHKLWKRTEKRAIDYTAKTKDVLAEITNSVVPNKRGEFIVHASDDKAIYCYVIEYGYTKNSYHFTKTCYPLNTISRRDFTLISLDEEASVLADKLLKYDTLSKSKLHNTVFEYFWNELKEQLEKKRSLYKPTDREGEMLIAVEIYSIVYNIGVKYTYGSYWYTWYGEDNRKIISFNRKKK